MPLFTTDFDGNVRGSAWDIGAYEYGSTAPGDTSPPAVSITSHANGAIVSGSVVIIATASDNVGVVGVQFKLNGTNLGTEDTSSPYSINWNTLTVSNGSYTISATARDAAGLTTTSGITVTVNNVSVPAPTPTLIAAYAFNEGAGTTSNDISGKNHTATMTGTSWNGSGKYGNSLTFNGTSSYAQVSDANDLDFTTGMTMSAWVCPTSALPTNGWVGICTKEYVYYLYASSSQGNVPVGGFVTGGINKTVFGTSVLPVNFWTHLAVTYDGSALRLYTNGAEVSNTPASGTITTSASPVWIGATNYGEYFSGKIDDVRIYNGALSQAAIQQDMNTALSGTSVPPTDTSLKVAYALGEGSGGTTSDVSGNTHTGTITGPTWTTSGKYGNALVFDGVNDFVTTSDANDLDFTNGMTLEAWIYPTGTSGDWTIVSKDYVYFLYARHTAYSNFPIAGFVKGGNNVVVTGVSALPANVWSHLVVTYDNSSLRLYVNGTQVKAVTTTGNLDTSTGPLWLGGNQSYGEYFPGRIDNVRLYNRALSVAEVLTNMNTAVAAGQDITPPIISSTASSNLTSSSARITWTTNEASDTQVEYGLTSTPYSNTSTLNSSLVTSHTVDLTGLVASTTYHYRVKSKDASNNLSMSSDGTFVTSAASDITAPVISGVGTSHLNSNSAVIDWTTNEASDSQVQYGPTTAYENGNTTLDASLTTSHSVGITGLTASTIYHYRVKSRDGAGNLATGNDNNLTTTDPPDTTAPTISNVLNSNPTASGTTVAWTTDEATNCLVEYGVNTNYGGSATDGGFGISHSVAVTGLTPGTVYHYRVKSSDSAGNQATSSDATFTTAVSPDISAPVISNKLPSGTFAAGTTEVTLSCITNELATVKYSTSSGTAFSSMTAFNTTGGTTHSTLVTGLVDGTTYTYYLKSSDAAGNVSSDSLITFSIASTPTQPPAATITVTAPATGENWKIGTSKTIRWSSTGVTSNVNIDMLRNSSYVRIFSNISNTGSKSWTVPSPKNLSCRIKVFTVDGSVVGVGNLFKIT